MKNFRVRCIRNENDGFTKGKVYKVRNGVIIDDDNCKASVNLENVEELNETFDSQFELIEKEPLKVGDYVVTKKKIKTSKKLSFMKEQILKKPIKVKNLSISGNIELSNGYFYNPNWLKKVEPPKKEPEKCKGFVDGETIFVYKVAYNVIETVDCYSPNKVLKWYIENGYAFHTKEEAERKKECMDILNKYKHEFSLKDWKNPGISKYSISDYTQDNVLAVSSRKFLIPCSSNIWFKTEEDAKKVIELIGYDDWCKYILNL